MQLLQELNQSTLVNYHYETNALPIGKTTLRVAVDVSDYDESMDIDFDQVFDDVYKIIDTNGF